MLTRSHHAAPPPTMLDTMQGAPHPVLYPTALVPYVPPGPALANAMTPSGRAAAGLPPYGSLSGSGAMRSYQGGMQQEKWFDPDFLGFAALGTGTTAGGAGRLELPGTTDVYMAPAKQMMVPHSVNHVRLGPPPATFYSRDKERRRPHRNHDLDYDYYRAGAPVLPHVGTNAVVPSESYLSGVERASQTATLARIPYAPVQQTVTTAGSTLVVYDIYDVDPQTTVQQSQVWSPIAYFYRSAE